MSNCSENIHLVKRGEIYFAKIEEGVGSEQCGMRPVLILQNDIGNKFSPTTIVALITKIKKKVELPTHYKVEKEDSNLPHNSVVLLEQIKTIDKKRLRKKVSKLNDEIMQEIDNKIMISLGLTNITTHTNA